jgi:Ca2+-binding EF-hand superfamily protein
LLQELESHTDYTVQAAFRTIDFMGQGHIDAHTIQEFFRVKGIYILQKEACAIIRRVDASCDGRISFRDFAEYF